MGLLSIIVPEVTTNLITNPSIEEATTGWTLYSAAVISRVSTQQRRQVYSLQVAPNAAVYSGTYYTFACTATGSYTFSADVKGESGVPYMLAISVTPNAPNVNVASEPFTGTGAWQRPDVTASLTNGTTYLLYVVKNNNADTNNFYVDGAQLEALAYATTYCDGDVRDGTLPVISQPAYEWLGAPHLSQSRRSAATAHGGRVQDLDTLCGVKVDELEGIGYPPIRHNIQDQALQMGARIQSIKVREKVLTLRAHTTSNTTTALYAARDKLIANLSPDRLGTFQYITLVYNPTGLRIRCYYDSGMEGQFLGWHAWENLTLRLIAYDPLWYEDGQQGVVLTDRQTPGVDYIYKREDGYWQLLSAGGAANGRVYAIAFDPTNSKRVYIGGAFTNIGGVAADYVVAYNSETEAFTVMGAAGAGNNGVSGTVYAIKVLPDGRVVVGGDFQNAQDGGGATVVNNIGVFNPTANTWAAMGAGANVGVTLVGGHAGAEVHAIALYYGSSVYVIAGGEFDAVDGAATAANNIGYYLFATNTWSDLGVAPNDGVQGGAAPNVHALAMDHVTGRLYVGGSFTTAGGVAARNRIAYCVGLFTWYGMSTGLNNTCRALKLDRLNDLIAGGDFTTAGGMTVSRWVFWMDDAFYVPIDGISPCTAIDIDGEDRIHLGQTTPDYYNIYNGGAVAQADFYPGTDIDALAVRSDGDIYISMDTSASRYGAEIVTVNNQATALCYPVIQIENQSAGFTNHNLQWLENQTTRKYLYLKDSFDIQPVEVVTFWLNRPDKPIESNLGRPIYDLLHSGGDLATFHLTPGNNALALCSETTLETRLYWDLVHWSVDGGES